MPRAKAPSSGPKPPPRTKVCEIIRRYIRDDMSPVWRREIPLMYTLLKQYPSLPFWERHTMGFKLRSLAWFMSIEGKATLASDYSVFHYNPEPVVEAVALDPLPAQHADVVDTVAQPTYHVPTPPDRKTVAGFLSAKHVN